MKVYDYKNYDEYVKHQTYANKVKLDWVYARQFIIDIVCDNSSKETNNILCHGTRNGAEQKMFLSRFPKAKVIGTEISETATKFELTVQHDFHEENPEWINKFDIVYSNAWDHSYDPIKSITAWKNQLNDKGKLFIEHDWNPKYNISDQHDPFQVEHNEILDIFKQVGLNLVKFIDNKDDKRMGSRRLYIVTK